MFLCIGKDLVRENKWNVKERDTALADEDEARLFLFHYVPESKVVAFSRLDKHRGTGFKP